MTDRTDEEYEAMRAELAEVDRQRALAQQAAIDAANAPLIAFLLSPDLAAVREALKPLCTQFRDDMRIYDHLRALFDIAARLEDEVRFRGLITATTAD